MLCPSCHRDVADDDSADELLQWCNQQVGKTRVESGVDRGAERRAFGGSGSTARRRERNLNSLAWGVLVIACLLSLWSGATAWQQAREHARAQFDARADAVATAVTSHKLRTLMHDTQYRTAIAWQNVAYNQPPHPSFFLVDGMATPAAPDIYFVGTNPNGGIASSASSSSRSSVAPSSLSSSSSSVASSAASSSSLASGGACSYVITNNWGSGFTGAIRITNRGNNVINGWNVSWSYSGNTRISNSWNATVSGNNPYSATNLGWNAVIQPGQTVEFGFQGTYSGSTETPVISGAVCN